MAQRMILKLLFIENAMLLSLWHRESDMTTNCKERIAFVPTSPFRSRPRPNPTFSRREKATCQSGRASRTAGICATAGQSPRTIIVGGGAAGFFCAIALSRLCLTSITILESTSEVLQKVRISGGGRCNVTSGLFQDDVLSFSAQYPRGAQEMRGILSRFGAKDVVQFFENEGVPLKTEENGKVFPKSDNSESIISALVRAAKRGGVQVRTCARVANVESVSEGFRVSLKTGDHLFAPFVVIATGSSRAPYLWAKTMGHLIIPPVPSLFSFRINDDKLQKLAGVSVSDVSVELLAHGNAKRRIRGLQQRGSLLVTHWGLSGPAILSLSAFGARLLAEEEYKMSCIINWVPQFSLNEKIEMLNRTKTSLGHKNISVVSPFRQFLPNRLWRYFLEMVDIGSQNWASVRKDKLETIANHIHAFTYQIAGKGEFKDEFVTAGGVALKHIDTKTFESKKIPGLYFAGEILDVDGRTGGFNLEFAWSSGYIAALSIAQKVLSLSGSTDRISTG